MEFINKIELQGIVGSVQGTKFQNDNPIYRFSLYTEVIQGDLIDCTWFSCTAWESGKIINLDKLTKGAKVHLTGRMKARGYVGSDGMERNTMEVICETLEIKNE